MAIGVIVPAAIGLAVVVLLRRPDARGAAQLLMASEAVA
jgi:hypothetical protein